MTTLSRRALVAGSAISVIPLATLAAAAPDPIYAAIEARKRTCSLKLPENPSDEEVDAICDVDNEAVRALLRTEPTTLAGAKAMIDYFIACVAFGSLSNESAVDDLLMEDPVWSDDGRLISDHTEGRDQLLKTLSVALGRLAR
jgi:hypothetical protein